MLFFCYEADTEPAFQNAAKLRKRYILVVYLFCRTRGASIVAQLSLYMDDIAMEELRADAEAAGKSISSYAREVLEKRHEAERGWVNGWPPGYFELFGSSPDFPDVVDVPPEPIAPLNTF